MRVLLLGSGGREHALAWKLAQSPLCSALYVAPGNAGTVDLGVNLAIEANDFDAVRQLCISKKIDMVIVGPEEPLVKGIVDFLKADKHLQKLMIIGPSKEGAQLEGSKAYGKAFMKRNDIPTASYAEFTPETYADGVEYLKQHALPIVLKADGLAAGKGVVICLSLETALVEFSEMLIEGRFGEAGRKVVVESFLEGIELSVFVLTDGRDYVILPEAKDYKRIGEGDKGLNTGGMGAVSPVPFADQAFMRLVEQSIVKPTIDGIRKEGIDYTGFIFLGLIKVGNDPFVIEYNCRMGDPETEVVIPRLENDLVELLQAAAKKELKNQKIKVSPLSCCTVVAVSGGYPGKITKGKSINGLDKPAGEESVVFHSGTSRSNDSLVTNGGRVLCISSFGKSIPQAVARSLEELSKIDFDGMYFRRDIGYEFFEQSL